MRAMRSQRTPPGSSASGSLTAPAEPAERGGMGAKEAGGEPAILVCTVGGAPQPILTALAARRWDRVVFVCTPAGGGAAGSVATVEGSAAGEPAIPEAAGLAAGSWEILLVPPDDPDTAFARLSERIAALRRERPGARITADFTGGTKSMGVALALAAVGTGAALQLVTGKRVDLVKVLDRSQQAIAVNTTRIAAAREFERIAAGWSRFAYQEAAEGFKRLCNDLKAEGLTRDDALLPRVTRAKELSEAFAAWDRFDHNTAANCLRRPLYRGREIAGRSDWAALAAALARGQNAPWGALHLRDLWHNAERCAARGRYDDAVARLYRLWEGSAQWLLRADCRIDTGVIRIGLKKAWDPVTRPGWESLAQWTRSGLLAVLAREAERLGEPHALPQLPSALPAL